MIAHNIYAQIFDETVQNVIVCEEYEMANWLSRQSYGDTAFAVDCMQYPCSIGDKYHNGTFYRIVDGEEVAIEYVPTQEQQVSSLEAENTALKQQVTDLQLAATELYEATMEV